MDAFYKASIFCGFNTYYVDTPQLLQSLASDTTLTITEGTYIDQNLLSKVKGKFFIHSPKPDVYNQVLSQSSPARFFFLDVLKKVSFQYNKISTLSFYDPKNFTLYQPWGTNLLPTSRSVESSHLTPKTNHSFYVGMLYGAGVNYAKMINRTFNKLSPEKKLTQAFNASSFLSAQLAHKSFYNFDIRDSWHLEVGYIPCRVFKILSYGLPIICNSSFITSNLNLPGIQLASCPQEAASLSLSSSISRSEMIDTRNYILANHTYINSIQNMLKIVDSVRS